MDKGRRTQPWHILGRRVLATMTTVVATAAAIVALTDTWDLVSKLTRENPVIAWGLLGLLLVVAVVSFRKADGQNESLEKNAREIRADIKYVSYLLGELLIGGPSRSWISDPSADMYMGSEDVEHMSAVAQRWTDSHTPIFDSKLRSSVNNAKTAFNQYWSDLQLRITNADDRTTIPLGFQKNENGAWVPTPSLQERRFLLIDRMKAVERRMYELRVHASDPESYRSSPE